MTSAKKFQQADGMTYAPRGKPNPVCQPGDFIFAATALDHGHINGQCNGLLEAGGALKWVYDPDPARVATFQQQFPQARAARALDEILADEEVRLVAAAAIPSERCALGLKTLAAGKDYFTDKTPFTTIEQLEAARRAVAETGRKYMVYYGERLHTEAGMFAGELVAQGAIGRVIQVIGFGPHRLSAPSRPDWFFQKAKYGGILTDIGSHQCEQFLHYTGAQSATVEFARVANHNHPDYPELEDFGEAALVAPDGASFYFRVDWFTPDGLRTWGDGRTFIQGTDGYIELRKYVDIATDNGGNQVFLVNGQEEKRFNVNGQVGYPFFGQLILDCLNRTETAMTQAHAFAAAELCLRAQARAELAD
ncbi:MAG: Gfo/Idh/MocA family oxidoreductase [Candidatus Marinimicrobia bacterium]|nr:Gfo/Idh/MocA family oxidoreductase [Candidatus Neomarinimicrobiota bacterium]